jgi:ubiquinone/menaquinone biosynthesis C-methylase UbiE
MKTAEAVALIERAVRGRGSAWWDLGAGDGTFTRALAEILGSQSTIVAVDRDAHAIAGLKQWSEKSAPNVYPVLADFTQTEELRARKHRPPDGMLLANSLHFVSDADDALARLVAMLRPRGRVVLVEYDRRAASKWVPYPVPVDRLPSLAAAAGLSEPVVVATRPSRYQGTIYAAWADRL